MQQIKGVEIASRVEQLLSTGIEHEQALYQVTQENIQHLPEHLKEDPQEIDAILNAVIFYADKFSDHLTGYEIHDAVLRKLLPKDKTERYIESLFKEVEL